MIVFRPFAAALLTVALSGCSHEESVGNTAEVNIDAAADRAGDNIEGDDAAPTTPHPAMTDVATSSPLGLPTPVLPPGDSSNGARVEDQAMAATRYRCIDGSRLSVSLDPRAKVAVLSDTASPARTLDAQDQTDGFRYTRGGYTFAGQGASATFERPGLPPLPCTAG